MTYCNLLRSVPWPTHSRDAPCWWTEVNRDTCIWTTGREWETLEHWVLNVMSSSNPPFQAQSSTLTKRWKDFKSQRCWMTPRSTAFRVQQDWCAMDSETIAAQIKPAQGSGHTGSQHFERGDGQGVPPLTKKLPVTDFYLQGKVSFLQWNFTGCINQGKPSA